MCVCVCVCVCPMLDKIKFERMRGTTPPPAASKLGN